MYVKRVQSLARVRVLISFIYTSAKYIWRLPTCEMFNELLVNKRKSTSKKDVSVTPSRQQQPYKGNTNNGIDIDETMNGVGGGGMISTSLASKKTVPLPCCDAIKKLFQDHIEMVEKDPLVTRNICVYYSILSGHLQDSLDDFLAYAKARKQE